jgi:hypothetical protein
MAAVLLQGEGGYPSSDGHGLESKQRAGEEMLTVRGLGKQRKEATAKAGGGAVEGGCTEKLNWAVGSGDGDGGGV